MASLMDAVANSALNRRRECVVTWSLLVEDDVSYTARLPMDWPGLDALLSLGPEIVHMELEDVLVINRVSDGVAMQLALKNILGGELRGLLAFHLNAAGVLLKDGRAGETEKLCSFRKKILR